MILLVINNNNSNKSWYTLTLIPFSLPQENSCCTTGALAAWFMQDEVHSQGTKRGSESWKLNSGQISWNQKSSTVGIVRLLLHNFHIRTNECRFEAQKSCSDGFRCIKILYLFFYLVTLPIFTMLLRLSLTICLRSAFKRYYRTPGLEFCLCDFVWVFSPCVFRMKSGFVNLCDRDTKNERSFTT